MQMAASDGSDDMSDERNRYSFASDDPSYRSGSAASSRPNSAGSHFSRNSATHLHEIDQGEEEGEEEEEENEMDEEIENRLMGMLLKGMVLQQTTCKVCSTPLLQSMDMSRGFINTPKDPVGGVPYCVSCVAHVATSKDEFNIIKESFPDFLDTEGLVLMQLLEGEKINEETQEEEVAEEQQEPESVQEFEKKPSWEGKRVKDLIEMIEMGYDKRRQIATKVLGVKMIQGYSLRETPCEECSMPLMQMPDSHEVTCVVCPVIKKKAIKKLKAQDEEKRKEEEANDEIVNMKQLEEEKRKVEDKLRKEAEFERERLEEKFKREAEEERRKMETQRKLEEERRLLELELKKEEDRRIAKRVKKKMEEEENIKRKENEKRLTELQIRQEERKRVVEELEKEKEEQEKAERLKAAEERAKQAEAQLMEWKEAKSKAEAAAQNALYEKELMAEQSRMAMMSREALDQRAEAEAKAAAAERSLLEAERKATAAAQRRRLAEERLEREARENEAKINMERAKLEEEALMEEEKLHAAEYNVLNAQRHLGGGPRVAMSRSGSSSEKDEDWDIEYDDDELDVRDDTSRSSRTVTIEIPENFDSSDPNALSQLMAKATISASGSRRNMSRGRSRSRSRSLNRQYDGYTDMDQGSTYRRKMLPPRAMSGLPRGRPQAGLPRPSYRSQSPRPTPEHRQAPSPGRRGRSRTPIGRREQHQPQEHPSMVTAGDDDDASYLTDDDDVSVATQTLRSIMMKIDECKAQLSQPVNLNDDDASVAASIAHQVEAADLIQKLASAAVAVKQLEGLQ